MARLNYQQKEEITRLRALEMSPGDIADRLGLGEGDIRSALRQRKLRGYFGLTGIFGFFTAIIITPFLNSEHLEGEAITDAAVMRTHLPGEWDGYWLSRGHKRPLHISVVEGSTGRWLLNVTAVDENCPGTGAYSGSGTLSSKGLSAKLVAAHPDCGELDIGYVMALGTEGTPQMKGEFLRMPTGDVGEHFVTRK